MRINYAFGLDNHSSGVITPLSSVYIMIGLMRKKTLLFPGTCIKPGYY